MTSRTHETGSRSGVLSGVSGRHAVVLHPPHANVEALIVQLDKLGFAVEARWPTLEPADREADVVFFDADMGHDGQFGWAAGEAPMPLVAIIGSEAPGRIGWALTQGADAHVMKPITSASGLFSALLIATQRFQARKRVTQDLEVLKERLARRPDVVRATILIMQQEGLDEPAATQRLRRMAMEHRRTIEDMAFEIADCPARFTRRGGKS